MEYAIYILIILLTVTQSATTKQYNRNYTNSVVFNALKASSAFLLFGLISLPGFTFHIPTVIYGACYGLSLSISMYVGYRALGLGPMALTSMLGSFSVLIPMVWGIAVMGEKPSPLQYVALVLLLSAILLVNADKFKPAKTDQKTNYGLWILFVAATFVCNGACSVLQKEYQNASEESYSREFMFFAMLVCTLIYVTVALIKLPRGEFKRAQGKKYGIVSGVTTALPNFLTLVLAGFENATILFPIISAGTIFGSLLCGRFIFKEKLKLNHYIALVVGVTAVVLLKL